MKYEFHLKRVSRQPFPSINIQCLSIFYKDLTTTIPGSSVQEVLDGALWSPVGRRVRLQVLDHVITSQLYLG